MWLLPVISGWLLVGYAVFVYVGKRRLRLWVLLLLTVVFAAFFAGWGFLCR